LNKITANSDLHLQRLLTGWASRVCLVCLLFLLIPQSHASNLRWLISNATFHIGDLIDNNVNAKEEFQEAASRLNDTASSFWIEVNQDAGSGFCTSSGDNSAQWSTTICGDEWGTNTLAVAQLYTSGSFLGKTDIIFNDNLTWSAYDGNYQSPTHDFRRVAVHELGHTIGLGHSSDLSAIMAPFVSNTFLPQLDDVSEIQSRYGVTYNTLTLNVNGNGYIQVEPLIDGTGVLNSTTDVLTNNSYEFLDCHQDSCELSIQDGLRLVIRAIADDEFVSWTETTITSSALELSPLVSDRTYTANFTSDPEPLTPTGVKSLASTSLASIQWNAATFATSYQVYRCEKAEDTECGDAIATVSTTIFSDTSGVYGKTYYYRIQACNTTGCSPVSDAVAGTRPFTTPPTPAVSPSAAYVVVAWVDYATVESVEVYRCKTADTTSCGEAITQTTSGFIIDRDGSPGVEYFYRIKDCFESSCGGFSNSAAGARTASVKAPLSPAAPEVSSTEGGVSLQWQSVETAEAYEVYRCTDNSEASCSDLLATVTETEYTDSAGTPGTEYHYRIKACLAEVCSDFSESVTGIADLVPIPSTPVLSPAEADAESITITWLAVDGADEYSVYVCSDDSTLSCGDAFISSAEITFSFTGGESGIDYYFRVQACNSGGCSDFSDFELGTLQPPAFATYSNGLLTIPAVAVQTTSGTDYYFLALELASSTPSFEFTINSFAPLVGFEHEEFSSFSPAENQLSVPKAEVEDVFYSLVFDLNILDGVERFRLIGAEETQ